MRSSGRGEVKHELIALTSKKSRGFYIGGLICFLVLACGLFFVIPDDECRIPIEILYIIVNLYILYASKKIFNTLCNGLIIFLFSVFIFNGIRIVFDLFGVDNMRELYSPFTTATITEYNNNRTILNVILCSICVSIGYLRYRSKNVKEKNTVRLPNPLLWFLFVIGFAAKIYVAYISFTFIMLLSYSEVFTDGIAVNAYLRGLSYLPVFVCLIKLKERKKIWILPMAIWALLHMATGQRGPGLLLLIFLFYYSIKLELVKLSLTKVGIAALVGIFLSIMVGNIRSGEDELTTSTENPVQDFLWQEGSSIIVLQTSIQDCKKLDYHFVDIFSNVTSIFFHYFPFLKSKKDSDDHMTNQVINYKYWSAYISYKTDPNIYFAGGGMGGNYIGQVYVVGREYLVIIVSILVGMFLVVLENKLLYGSIIMSYIAFSVFQSIIYIPRDNLLDFITDLMPVAIMLLLFLIITFAYMVFFRANINLKKLF